ncbi:MAG TPA: hypothetical protein VIL04_00780 [Solirubrobacterales bacterium]
MSCAHPKGRGTIKFKGEQGYTKVSKRRARGFVSRPGNFECPETVPPGQYVYLTADRTRPKGSVSFLAYTFTGDGVKPTFEASADESVGAVDILRFAGVKGSSEQFTFELTEPFAATVHPPAPFSGTAAYDGADESWTGNLKVKLPGKTYKLTGSGFGVVLDLLESEP